jgi:hypothetical protein
MTEALLMLENSSQREGYKLGLETMDNIFRCETSHLVWNNGTLKIYLHIPTYKIDSPRAYSRSINPPGISSSVIPG